MKIKAAIRRLPTTARNAVRDLRYGGLLGGTTKTRQAELGAHDIGNSDYDDLERLFAGIELAPEDVIVDVGSGKGRAINWFLTRYPGNRIYGIELDPDVAARSARRLRRQSNVTIVAGDATALLPPDGTLFYLSNPFGEAVMRRFVEALRGLVGARRIVYLNCKFVGLFEDDPRFEVHRVDGPSLPAAVIDVR